MRTFRITLKKALATIALFITAFSYGLTYTSIADGDWSDDINVWSTDGITPCGCSPGANISNKDIIINHNITTTYDLYFTNGTNVTVNSIGSLGSGYKVEVESSTFNILGVSTFVTITQMANSEVNIIGTSVTLNNKYDLQAGQLNISGSYLLITSGDLDVSSGAEVNVTNSSKIDLVDGKVQNYGFFYIETGSCVSASEEWINQPSGTVSGAGSAISTGGYMRNDNIWDPLINWCSADEAYGMPSSENCGVALDICNGIELPVELIALQVTASENNTAKISWITASERNSAYFKVMKLIAGEDWKEIDRVTAAENSSTLRNYSSIDSDFNVGDVYYRLIQVDLNGTEYNSDVVSITFDGTDIGAFLYPNPVASSEKLTITNLSSESSTITIISLGLNVVMEKVSVPANRTVNLSMEKLQSGLYFVKVEQRNSIKTIKLVVKE